MPKSKHKRKDGRNKVTARSRKTGLRALHKQHAAKRRDRAYQRIRELQQSFTKDDEVAFEEVLDEVTE